MGITKQNMELLIKNIFIFCNYEDEVKKHNSCVKYIRTPKKVYQERVLNLLETYFSGKSEEEIIQIFRKFCE